MPSRQYELCASVLRRLRDARVLDHLVLVGSWCLVLYREYFRDVGRVDAVRTRDMDFLVRPSPRFRTAVNLPDLLRDLGFIEAFRGSEGYMALQHPELMIELLVPERGRGTARARNLPELGMNAQALRFMDVALLRTIRLHFDEVEVPVPHPAAFALHKLLVAPRRSKKEKKRRDTDHAIHVLKLLVKKGEAETVRELLAKFPGSWKKQVSGLLAAEGETELLTLLGVSSPGVTECRSCRLTEAWTRGER